MQLIKDPRVAQSKKLISSLFGSTNYELQVMITRDNTLVIIMYSTALYIIPLTGVQEDYQIGFLYQSNNESLDEDSCIYDENILRNVEYVYLTYLNIMNPLNLLACEPELRGNEELEKLLSMKIADGCKFFKINGNNLNQNYYFPIFSGFPNINKADKIGFEVYNIGDGYLLNVMNVFKKKINRSYKLLNRVINLDRSYYE